MLEEEEEEEEMYNVVSFNEVTSPGRLYVIAINAFVTYTRGFIRGFPPARFNVLANNEATQLEKNK